VALVDAAALSRTQQAKITTIVAGYNKVTVGINISSINHGTLCAEDLVVAQLGGTAQISNIIMTPAVRPRTGQIYQFVRGVKPNIQNHHLCKEHHFCRRILIRRSISYGRFI